MTLICSAAEGGTVSLLQMHIDLPFLFDPLSLSSSPFGKSSESPPIKHPAGRTASKCHQEKSREDILLLFHST